MKKIGKIEPPPFSLYGIFGFPLKHTHSPGMQEAAFRKLGIPAFYLPFEISLEGFRRLMAGRRRLILDGFNVTVPYKEEALRWLDQLSPDAREIGAVNTAVRSGKRWAGFNTDWIGFLRSLERDRKFKIKGKRALVLGAGGSARAVAYALARGGARRIVILNRTPAGAGKLISRFRRLFHRVEFIRARSPHLLPAKRGEEKGGGRFDLVVNATPVGLKRTDRSLVSPRDFPKKTLFVDLIYNPSETRLLRLARESGHRTLNGEGMLREQGAEAFRIWIGRKAPRDAMKKALELGRP